MWFAPFCPVVELDDKLAAVYPVVVRLTLIQRTRPGKVELVETALIQRREPPAG